MLLWAAAFHVQGDSCTDEFLWKRTLALTDSPLNIRPTERFIPFAEERHALFVVLCASKSRSLDKAVAVDTPTVAGAMGQGQGL